ncbi:hypothetical protein [Sulfurospirillum sp. hDNRA2]|uniref:hypothetical protein n=1 Tax=Sulfurospirillum sp. hDNRA2 TaxID=3237298 RepID=UPI0020B655A6|nr:hypothetical protein [Sulfurospirillum sp. DNRA8]MCP3653132.1 hypothetical protein [Sulfurospirillum sp. DNRA8]MCR1811983.1 hypothetical protein [Sulfurospirillum sp. DNRA8]
MEKFVILLSSVLFLVGCASTYNYRASDFNDLNKDYIVDAKMKKVLETQFFGTTTKNILSLYINNQLILEGALDIQEAGTFKSMYDGKQLTLECYKVGAFSIEPYCQVHLDQRKIGSFKLKMDR